MTGMLRVPRSRGALNGVLLVLLGLWGGLIAFVGPYFHYAYTPDKGFTYTTGRLWLEILPAAGTILGGLIIGGTASRPAAIFGSWLAALSGAWFALGGSLSALWHTSGSAGQPVGDNLHRVVEQIGFFTGLGLVIVFLAAVALGRFTVIGARERALAEGPAAETVPVEKVPVEKVPVEKVPVEKVPVEKVPANETTRPVGTHVPETADATVPASSTSSASSATRPSTNAEETRVAGSSDARDTTIA